MRNRRETMKISDVELASFKKIYFKHYKVQLTDEEAINLSNRLLGFINAIAKQLPTAVQFLTK